VALPEVPVGNTGNVEIFFIFTMAWKCFCYISEVSGLVHKYTNHMIIQLALAPSSTTSALLLVSIVHYPLLDLSDCCFFLSEMFLFIHVEDNGILVEYIMLTHF